MEELFGASGAEVGFRPVSAEDENDSGLTFRSLQQRLAAHGEILLGLMRHSDKGSQIQINPPGKNLPLSLQATDELIVLDVV
jgi:hypothetical protein